MTALRRLRDALLLFLRILFVDWQSQSPFVALVRDMCALLRRRLARRRLPERERKASDESCVTVPRGMVKHPDPLIYSQLELMRLGYAVTWNNPDVQLFRAGLPVSSWDLEPATEYEVVARVWNKSRDAPVIALPVIFSMLSFGIGARLDVIGVDSIPHLGVKGGPNSPAFARTTWTTPATAGHYCIQVFLDPADDADRGNNLGGENTLVGHPDSPAEFPFELRNDTRQNQTYRFELDTYEIPPVRDCSNPVEEPQPENRPETDGPRLPATSVRAVPAAHDRRNYPLPTGWSVDISPESPGLAPEESVTVRAVVTPPEGFVGRQAINVNAFHSLGPAGGVTFYVDVA